MPWTKTGTLVGAGGGPTLTPTTITASRTAVLSAYYVADASTARIDVTLPTGAAAGKAVRLEKIDGSTNMVTLVPGAGETINRSGNTVYLLTQNDSADVISDGAGNWDLRRFVSAATAGSVAKRDGSGRLQVADPVAAADAATKNYTDTATASTLTSAKSYTDTAFGGSTNMRYKGVFSGGATYTPGDVVTYQGTEWAATSAVAATVQANYSIVGTASVATVAGAAKTVALPAGCQSGDMLVCYWAQPASVQPSAATHLTLAGSTLTRKGVAAVTGSPASGPGFDGWEAVYIDQLTPLLIAGGTITVPYTTGTAIDGGLVAVVVLRGVTAPLDTVQLGSTQNSGKVASMTIPQYRQASSSDTVWLWFAFLSGNINSAAPFTYNTQPVDGSLFVSNGLNADGQISVGWKAASSGLGIPAQNVGVTDTTTYRSSSLWASVGFPLQQGFFDASKWARLSDAEPAGTVKMWAGLAYPLSQIPAGYLLCDGSICNSTQYPALWSAIGSLYGVGDGSAGSFNLPNFNGAFPMGAAPGSTGGAMTHSHPLSDSGWANIGFNAQILAHRKGSQNYTSTETVAFSSAGTVAQESTGRTSVSMLGGASDAASSLPPYVGISFIIRAA